MSPKPPNTINAPATSQAATISARFGRLVIIEPSLRGRKGDAYWLCRCDCGNTTRVAQRHLRNGAIQSCNCLRIERTVAVSLRHGEASGGITPEYHAWEGAKNRCVSPRQHKNYGSRGITVADVFAHDPKAFIEHVGRRPSPKHSIDRIDNDKGYEPGNLRWATPTEQARNKRNNKLSVEKAAAIRALQGVQSGRQVAALYGVAPVTIQRIWKDLLWR